MNLDNNIGWNKSVQNNTIQNSIWNANTNNNVIQRIMWALNPTSSILEGNRKSGTSSNNNSSNLGWGQNRIPKNNEQIYQKRKQ